MRIDNAQILGDSSLSGSLTVTGGTVIGTASFATSSSFATTASFALNAGGSGNAFPYTGSADITGSLFVTGSSGLFGNMSLTSGSSFIDITPLTGSNFGYKIGSNWVTRYDSSRNNLIIGSSTATYASVTGSGGNNFFAGGPSIANGLTTGFNNIAIGSDTTNNEPLRSLTTGQSNIALGRGGLRSLSVGNHNISIGELALYTNQSSSHNIAMGYTALNVYTRVGSIAIGHAALNRHAGNAASDDYNVAIGYNAGINVVTGSHVLIGAFTAADMTATTSNNATAIGPSAGYGLRTSNNDTVVGALAMWDFNGLGTTRDNVAIGYGAMEYASSSRYMVAIGYEAGYQNRTATGLGSNDGSVYVGYRAGRLTLGNYNVFLGYDAGATITAASNTFILANSSTDFLITGSFTTKRVDFFGSVNAPSFTGSLLGTASYASQALSASFATTASYAAVFPFTGSAAITGSLIVTGSSGFFGNMSLTSASSFIDVTPLTGSTMGYKIGSNWVVRYDTSRNNFMFGSRLTTYPSITTGFNNFFAGNDAIALGLTSGNNNIAIGFDNSNSEPLRNLTTGFNNIALGRASLKNNSVGEANIGIGVFSLNANQSGSNNVAIGYNSLLNYTRFGAIAIGFDAFGNNFVGNDGIAIGYTAGRNVSNGRHVLIGYLAGRDMSGAGSDFTVAIGPSAGYGLRTSISDTIIGSAAMGWFNSLGSTTSNVAVGHGAMQLASSSRYMVAVGYEAGYQNATATGTGSNDGSVYLGYTAGRLTLGNYNVFIGYAAGSTITAASNTFILANSSTNLLITGSFSTKRVDFFGSVNAPSFTGSIQATGSLNFNGSELSTAWTSYTPVWTAASSDPVIGDGTITGQYKVIGKTCFVRGRLVMGTTTTYGTGAWYFQLPFTASSAYGIQIPSSFLDNGINWYSGLMNGGRLGSSTRSEIQWQNTSSVAVGLESTVPFTWGNLDEISWNGSYEIA
jgi:hypothetical protein